MTARKQGTGRRLVEHTCGAWDCDNVLTLGPARPRPAVGQPVAVDWFSLTLREKYVRYYGSLEAAEAAWRFHRGQLASLDRIHLGLGERPAGPVAREVFEEPGAPWPPPLTKEPA